MKFRYFLIVLLGVLPLWSWGQNEELSAKMEELSYGLPETPIYNSSATLFQMSYKLPYGLSYESTGTGTLTTSDLTKVWAVAVQFKGNSFFKLVESADIVCEDASPSHAVSFRIKLQGITSRPMKIGCFFSQEGAVVAKAMSVISVTEIGNLLTRYGYCFELSELYDDAQPAVSPCGTLDQTTGLRSTLEYDKGVEITLSAPSGYPTGDELTICYTLDGSSPSSSSTRQAISSGGTIFVSQSGDCSLRACNRLSRQSWNEDTQSWDTAYYYTMEVVQVYRNTEECLPPTLNPPSSTFLESLQVSIVNPDTESCVTYFTVDGTDPRTSSTRSKDGTVLLTDTCTVKAVCSKKVTVNGREAELMSTVTEGEYQCNLSPAAPCILPSDGTRVDDLVYGQNEATVSMSTDMAEAFIYYTLDGSVPVVPGTIGGAAELPTRLYSVPFVIREPGINTVKAVAARTGRPDSELSESRVYLYDRPRPPQIIYEVGDDLLTVEGRFLEYPCEANEPIWVKILNPNEYESGGGPTLYYTTDGQLPTTDHYQGTCEPMCEHRFSYYIQAGKLYLAVVYDKDGVASRTSGILFTKSSRADQKAKLSKVDLNGNGKIDVGDFTLLQGLWGTTGAYGEKTADFNGNGLVEQRDLDTMGAVWWNSESSLSDDRFSKSCLIIDVSGGPDASRYPYEFLDSVPGGSVLTDVYRTGKIVLMRIPAGVFTMGSSATEVGRQSNGDGTSDEDACVVTLSSAYYLGVFEVTQQQWYNVMGDWPSYYNEQNYRPTRPVESVSYADIRGSRDGVRWPASDKVDSRSFLGRLREKTGLWQLDLPTEAQWERACRAYSSSPFPCFSWGLVTASDRVVSELDSYARYVANNADTRRNVDPVKGGTAIVGTYQGNLFGLYDMMGNVAEWCLDSYGTYPGEAAVDPEGVDATSYRVVRGGGCKSYPAKLRSAARDKASATSSMRTDVGFRIAMWLPF